MMLHFLCVDFQYDGVNVQGVRMSLDIDHIYAVWLSSAEFRVFSNDPNVENAYRIVNMQRDVHQSEWACAALDVSTD